MRRYTFIPILLVIVNILVAPGWAQENDPLASVENLDLVNVKASITTFQGQSAIRLEGTRMPNAANARGAGRPAIARQPGQGLPNNGERAAGNRMRRARPESIAIVKGTNFRNGTIELELAGRPSPTAGPNARGFIGIAFHVQKGDTIQYDCFYLRPTNGRADDQLRRNHSCQYMSHPDYPFNLLRRESPGVYESYVDLVPGEWTQVKIEVDDQTARLFVHGSKQPCLVVNDVKLAGQEGGVALWMEQSTDAYFRNLVLSETSVP